MGAILRVCFKLFKVWRNLNWCKNYFFVLSLWLFHSIFPSNEMKIYNQTIFGLYYYKCTDSEHFGVFAWRWREKLKKSRNKKIENISVVVRFLKIVQFYVDVKELSIAQKSIGKSMDSFLWGENSRKDGEKSIQEHHWII